MKSSFSVSLETDKFVLLPSVGDICVFEFNTDKYSFVVNKISIDDNTGYVSLFGDGIDTLLNNKEEY